MDDKLDLISDLRSSNHPCPKVRIDEMTWLVAIAEPLRQSQALSALSGLDFITYSPQYQEKIVRSGRVIPVVRYLFGHYFFVYMCDRWREVHDTKAVSRVLMGPDEQPLPVRDYVIEEIKNREINGVVESVPSFWYGQRVKPKSGHLAGVEGRFYKTARNDKEIALFKILGKEMPVEFAPGVLVASDIEIPNAQVRRNKRMNKRLHHTTA